MNYTFWAEEQDEILTSLAVDPSCGLSQSEVKERQKAYGKNELLPHKAKGTLKLFFAQINTPLIYMLLFAALLSLILYDKTDALIIFTIIIASASLSFFQEKSALNTMEKLLQIVQITADVLRDGKKLKVPVEEVVPGDIILLAAGDVVPCDARLLEAKDLFVDEATLTGETFYAEKRPGLVAEDAPLAKRYNTLFMGTHVMSGEAVAVAIVTGTNSEFGQISKRVAFHPPETEFEESIRRFGYFLGEVTLILLVLIFGCNVFLGRSTVESLLFALALSVGLTPQLLPAIISVNLAHGAKLMAKKEVIVKRLASIENFGSMNILCADKTGTLTTTDIVLQQAVDCNGNRSDELLLLATVNALFQTGYNNTLDKAILDRGLKPTGWKKLDELPYDFMRKRLSILAEDSSGILLLTKGAFTQVAACCNNVGHEQVKQFTDYSNQGLRVLGLACKKMQPNGQITVADESNMTFLGFLLFYNPPKEGIANTIIDLKKQGVALKIITGDNKLVTQYIAKEIGIAHDKILTGSEIRQMSDHALIHHAMHTTLFTEVEPNQKERIILALRKSKNVVGFMGDGINDVSGLHTADVSISVDQAADAAKEVADIVLLKRDLSVLKDGVVAGRTTFANTLKYIFMATSANFGNMFSMAGASLFLPFLPLLPKQVLLTNLLTDLPEMTIATDSVDKELLEKPLRLNLGFIRRFMLIFGLISSIFDYATFGLLLYLGASQEQFRTGWFIESVASASIIVLVVRTFKPFYTSRPSRYLLTSVCLVVACTALLPYTPLASSLQLAKLPPIYYAALTAIVVLYIAAVEAAKKLFLKNHLKF